MVHPLKGTTHTEEFHNHELFDITIYFTYDIITMYIPASTTRWYTTTLNDTH